MLLDRQANWRAERLAQRSPLLGQNQRARQRINFILPSPGGIVKHKFATGPLLPPVPQRVRGLSHFGPALPNPSRFGGTRFYRPYFIQKGNCQAVPFCSLFRLFAWGLFSGLRWVGFTHALHAAPGGQ